jgi:hypothetical protein
MTTPDFARALLANGALGKRIAGAVWPFVYEKAGCAPRAIGWIHAPDCYAVDFELLKAKLKDRSLLHRSGVGPKVFAALCRILYVVPDPIMHVHEGQRCPFCGLVMPKEDER